MNRRLFSHCAVTLMTALLVTLTAEAVQPSPLDVSRLVPSHLVKVTRLTGLGPDGTRHQLMAAPEGVAVPFDGFSSLAIHLTVDERTTTVAYHTLQAELAPGVFVLDEAGNIVRVALSGSAPRLIPLVGAVLSQNGEIKALGLSRSAPIGKREEGMTTTDTLASVVVSPAEHPSHSTDLYHDQEKQ